MVYVPDLHVSSRTTVKGKGTVKIISRKDAAHSGEVYIEVDVIYAPPNNYPVLTNLFMKIDLSESLKCSVTGKTVEQISTEGKHTPTVYFTGRCNIDPMESTSLPTKACRYWLLIASNKKAGATQGTPDIVSFLIYNCDGTRIAYGTGPLVDGDIDIAPV
jgi:hypothetical protein